MQRKNSIHLILELEEKIATLVKAHKALQKDVLIVKKELKQAQKNKQALEKENIELREQLKQQAVQKLVLTEGGGEELKQYLDKIIAQIDQNIKML